LKTLIFSDIHGNLPAFEKMLEAEPEAVRYISLGDVVNYGPWSNECVDLLESLNAIRIRGNHESYFIHGKYPRGYGLVSDFFNVSYARFSRQREIAKYIEHYTDFGFTFQHTINDEYLFPDSVIDIVGNYFIGHSHHQFDRKSDLYHVVNVGSVGQNRKAVNVINYAIYESETGQITLKSIPNNVESLLNKMRSLDYPQHCLDYYLKKII
jgi:predicted phosphodiesterase